MCVVICFLAPGCCLRLLPDECEYGPAACSGSAPRGFCLPGRHSLGLSDPSHRHWHRSGSGRAGNRYMAPRQELTPAQPSSGQGKSRPFQTLGHISWNEKKPYLCSNKELQPQKLFLEYFFSDVFFSAVMSSFS